MSIRRVLEPIAIAAFLGFAVWAVARQWSAVSRTLGDLSPGALTGSVVAALVGTWCAFRCWRSTLHALSPEPGLSPEPSPPLPMTGAMRIFFTGQVAKYAPGKVWPVLIQMRLGSRYAIPARVSAAAGLVPLGLMIGTGLLVAVCALPALGAGAFGTYWWTLLALPAAVIGLLPPVLNRVLNLMLRVARREPLPRPLNAGGIARAAGWALGIWAAYGVHLWLLLGDLGGLDGQTGLAGLARSIGAFAGAWSIGFLILISPAGIGPREVALVVLLQSTVTGPIALVAALISRLILAIGDLLWAGAAIVLERRRLGRLGVSTGHDLTSTRPGDETPQKSR